MTQTPNIEQLMATVRTEAEALVQPLVQESELAVQKIAQLQKQLEDAAPAPQRQALEINPDFDPDVHLEPQQRAIRKELYEWLDHLIKQTIEPVSRGMKPNSVSSKFPKGVPLLNGTLHLKSMREVGYIVVSLSQILERWGDPAAWERLEYVIKVVWEPSRMATKYDPGASVRYVTVSGKKVTDEQPGLMRFNYQKVDLGTHSAADTPAYVGTDIRHDLDHDLHTAAVGVAKLAAKHNIPHSDGTAYGLLRRYTDNLIARLKFTAEGYDPKRKWYVRGKSLRHPARARHTFHRTEYLDSGDPEQLEAAEFYGKMLASDVDYVQVEGQWVAVAPHYTRALQVERGQSGGSWGHQDISYRQEDAGLELMLYRLGDPHVPLGYLAASANTIHMLVMNTGALGPTISASVGGNGPTSDNGKKVISYRGKTYPTKRMYQGRAHSTDPVFQISRGLATIYSFAAGNPRYFQQLIELSDRPDSDEHRRFGARVALMEFMTPQRIDL